MLGYRVIKMPAFAAIKSLTPEQFVELQEACEFNRARQEWKRLGRKLISAKPTLVRKPYR